LLLERAAQVVVGVGVAGCQPQRLVVTTFGLGEAPQVGQGQPEVVVYFRRLRQQPDRLAEQHHRRGGPARLHQRQPQSGIRVHAIGLALQRPAVGGHGFVALAAGGVQVPQAEVRRGIVGPQPGRQVEFEFGLLQLAVLVEGGAEVEMGLGKIRVELAGGQLSGALTVQVGLQRGRAWLGQAAPDVFDGLFAPEFIPDTEVRQPQADPLGKERVGEVPKLVPGLVILLQAAFNDEGKRQGFPGRRHGAASFRKPGRQQARSGKSGGEKGKHKSAGPACH
jgi:hypothetical protein